MTVDATPRSRRAMLAAAVGGLGGFIAASIGRPRVAEAAAGDALRIGQSNSGGSSQTVLISSAPGASFTLKDTAEGGTGIFGWSSAVFGAGRGLYGRADSQGGVGVHARNTNANGDGIFAEGGTNEGAGIWATGANGVIGMTDALQRAAIYGENTAVTGSTYGLSGWVNSDTGSSFGLWGHAEAGYGAYAESQSGTAVRAVAYELGKGVDAFSVSGVGVYAASTNDNAVEGYATTGTGLAGYSDSGIGTYGFSEDGYGVYGSSTTDEAAHFDGTLYATTATASVKAFRIDHPLDPAGKVLQHSCVESNERKLVYDGVVTTDAKGEATISLPAYFEALNRDVRYQLTVIGSFAQAIVSSKVQNNRFAIRTSEPRTEVSWQVSGVRQDAYAKAHPIEVEAPKRGKEVGRYLTPREHGQPALTGVAFEAREQARTRAAVSRSAPVRATAAGGPARSR